VDDGIGTLDRSGHRLPIGERRLDQSVWDAVEIGEAADRKVVEDADVVAALDEEARQRRPDEPCPADDEDGPVQRR
jgi:hypothetical protein